MEEQEASSWFGIGLDDESAVIVDKHGEASVFGGDTFVVNTIRPADTLNQGLPLTIDSVEVFRFTPGERFQLAAPSLSAEADMHQVDSGVLKSEP
jgi:cyanophycinase-like exopeptidase